MAPNPAFESSILENGGGRAPLVPLHPVQMSTALPTIDAAAIGDHVREELESRVLEPASLFKIQSASEWMRQASLRPIPKRLYGNLIFEGELVVLFADTGLGKTILAVQICDAITSGRHPQQFPIEAPLQRALHIDFELTDKQFEARYAERGDDDYFLNRYKFDDRFERAEIDLDAFEYTESLNLEKLVAAEIELAVKESGIKFLVIDNITYLRNSTETAKDALPLMKDLNRLKKQYGLTILVLAHTPKRDQSRPLSINDLGGSKMISNFADGVFAIGASAKDKSLRYIKQFKSRSSEVMYDSENVIVCEISKPRNFLSFEFREFGREREHLNTPDEQTRLSNIETAKALAAEGLSQRAIADKIGISLGAVNKYLKL